ncbi:MAG TPA: Sec-independent protein translocase protein TatB [Polyangiaceae bacterium]|nr:Sec-independent protein translocase protein TatB [Polyangiaceae bacterium]
MFGLSFTELLVVIVVGLVVLGPKDLPRYLRKAGQFAGQIRNWAFDMRHKSGIDEILRVEGLDRDIAEIRKLTRGELTGIVGAIRSAATSLAVNNVPASPYAQTQYPETQATSPMQALPPAPPPVEVDREREYPREGPDSYGALPDTAVVYEGSLPPSPLSEDPLYARGEETA